MKLIPTAVRTDFRRNPFAWYIIIAVTLVLVVFTFRGVRLTTNPMSRFITVERLVEAGTFVHEGPEGKTPFELSIDHVKVGDRIYSSKPPNYPMLMAAEAWPIRKITGWNFFEHKVDYLRILTLLNQVLPYTLMLITALFLLREFTEDKWTLNFMMLAMSVGSLAYGYAVTINNHTVAAILFFVAFALVYRISTGEKGFDAAFFAGLMAGFAATVELPGLVFPGLFGLMILKGKWQAIFPFLLGIALPVAASMVAFYEMSGSVKPFYLQGHLYRYEGSYWTKPEGLDVLQDPWYKYLFHLLFGHHGLFAMTPVLLLGAWGAIKARPEWRLAAWGTLAAAAVVVIFILRRTHNYGGYCVGPRWFIHFMPLLMFFAFPVVEKMGKSLAGRSVAIGLLLLSLPWNAEALYYEGFIRSTWEKWWLGNEIIP